MLKHTAHGSNDVFFWLWCPCAKTALLKKLDPFYPHLNMAGLGCFFGLGWAEGIWCSASLDNKIPSITFRITVSVLTIFPWQETLSVVGPHRVSFVFPSFCVFLVSIRDPLPSFTHSFCRTPFLTHKRLCLRFTWQAWHLPSLHMDGVALRDIHLRITWQARRFVTSTFVLHGKRGALGDWAGSGGALGLD